MHFPNVNFKGTLTVPRKPPKSSETAGTVLLVLPGLVASVISGQFDGLMAIMVA